MLKCKTKVRGENGRGEWGSGPGSVEEDQVGCEPRIEVIVKKQTKNVGGLIGEGGWLVAGLRLRGGGRVGDGDGVGYRGCEPKLKVLLNVQKGIVQY